MDTFTFPEVQIPEAAIRCGLFLSQDVENIMLLVYSDKDTIRYGWNGKQAESFRHIETTERITSWTTRLADAVLDSYLDIGCVELGRWKPDTGWILRRGMFSKYGLQVPKLPAQVSQYTWF